MHLCDRELATVLAALRYWQQDLAENEEEGPISDHFEDVTPLTVKEINDLCARLDCGGTTESACGQAEQRPQCGPNTS